MSDQKHVCPRCGTRLVVRRNRKTGAFFWGCENYECSFSRTMTLAEQDGRVLPEEAMTFGKPK